MRKIGICADCSSGVEYAPFKNDVRICRTTIHFGEEELVDGIDINADQFYEKLKTSEVVPSTSAPTMGMIKEVAEKLRDEGCTDVILFTISNGLSTYGANVREFADELVEGVKLHIYDSSTACLMEGYLAHYAEILAAKGYSVEEIFQECDKLKNNTNAYFVVDDLKYLVKNGRLSGAAGFIGSLVSIKPVLNLGQTDKIFTFEKVRTWKKATDFCYSTIIEEAQKFNKCIYLVLHTGLKETAEEFALKLRNDVKNAARIEVTTITPTVGAHIGNGILGIARLGLDDLKEEL